MDTTRFVIGGRELFIPRLSFRGVQIVWSDFMELAGAKTMVDTCVIAARIVAVGLTSKKVPESERLTAEQILDALDSSEIVDLDMSLLALLRASAMIGDTTPGEAVAAVEPQ